MGQPHRVRQQSRDRMPDPLQAEAATPPQATRPVRSIAYLVSRYPTLSMTFVVREVLALRALGFRIETASINPPNPASGETHAARARRSGA